ncbi:MAG: hypothetical protein WED01_15150 [Candidatus Rokuibacteriota bacterium]
MMLSARAGFPLARQLRAPEGAPLGDVFSFVSGLYFRGKLAYARAFAGDEAGVLVITPHAGLRPAATPVTGEDLRAAARVDISLANPVYRRALEASATELGAALGPAARIVLLGSIASDKYVSILGPVFGERLLFPAAFVGRGDMSRGGLLLRCVREGRPLDYVSVLGATRHGARPPRLTRQR